MTVNEKIAYIRKKMEENCIDAILVPSADPHMSEYVSDHWKTRAFVSGFSGSAGTFVITREMSGLWTDGRYYVQAAKELAGSEATLFRAADADCPSPVQYLKNQLSEGSIIGLNGRLFSAAELKKMRKDFSEKGMEIDISVDYANDLWEKEGRPAEIFTEAYALDVIYTGKSASEKLTALREKLTALHADAIAVSKLDNIAWLFNLRANDVENNPVLIAYAWISPDEAILFTEQNRISSELTAMLGEEGISLRSYEEIYDFLAQTDKKFRVLCDEKELNSALWDAMEQNETLTVMAGEDPIFLMKACKNSTENTNTQNAYRKDGCALAEFYGWLYEELEKGTELTEYQCSEKLAEFRHAQPLNRGDSFGAIVAYRENAAMMHYAPKADSSAKLERKSFLLIDSGGQYLDGTTDITRTFALGPINETERHDFTLALKGSIALMEATFKYGQSGSQLDVLCREYFWREGLDYRCGTGHGVGFMLNVHEGPQGFGSPVKLEEGMVLTVEPGVYREGEHGIRTENVVHVIKKEMTEYGQMMGFENFTLVPIDRNCLEVSIMTDYEIDWLNRYHEKVWHEISPLVSERARKWLEKYTAPVSR
ncbi:MAG: aminopeptidase P family protein [Candidatus Merdivicinus sp.]|jgi:Xaa-Pro aminopeptidase